jgi:hypothetical protein
MMHEPLRVKLFCIYPHSMAHLNLILTFSLKRRRDSFELPLLFEERVGVR